MKKQRPAAFPILILFLFIAGCAARTWESTPIESYRPSQEAPPASVCQSCHQAEYDSWMKTRHSSEDYMAVVPVKELRGCGACHDNIAGHVADSNVKPGNPAKLDKTEQNTTCGKCHFNQAILGKSAINPDDKHSVFMSVGFQGKKRQIACLDCHSGHKGKSEMLITMKAHICFTCHKEAIVTMGVFQPFNYLFVGKACQGCHAVHGGSSGAQAARMGTGFCIVCHFVGTSLAN